MSKPDYDVDFDVARDILADYNGTLANVICLLEERPGANLDELDAYRKEVDRVGRELVHMVRDDQDLINKALYIYAGQSNRLAEKYLLSEKKGEER